jgi:hypothetical protein
MSHAVPALPVTHDPALLNATSRVVDAALQSVTTGTDGSLQSAIRALCADARRLHVRPEALIIQFKTIWRAHVDHRRLSRDDAERLLDHVISTCIEEYYRGD